MRTIDFMKMAVANLEDALAAYATEKGIDIESFVEEHRGIDITSPGWDESLELAPLTVEDMEDYIRDIMMEQVEDSAGCLWSSELDVYYEGEEGSHDEYTGDRRHYDGTDPYYTYSEDADGHRFRIGISKASDFLIADDACKRLYTCLTDDGTTTPAIILRK